MVTFAAAVILLGASQSKSLDAHVTALASADQLNAALRIQEVGGSLSRISVNLAKPNKARIDLADRLIVADGTTVTTLLKGENQFFKKPQTEAELKGLFADRYLQLFAPFFGEGVPKGLAAAKDGPARRGLNTVTATMDGSVQVTLFTDPSDKVARQAQFVEPGRGASKTFILSAESLTLKGGADSLFAFAPPANAKEVSEADLLDAKFVKFDEAMAKAKNGNRLIMVDFMAEWCGPCKMMEKEVFQTAAFKEAVKGMVLAKVDVDREQALAQRYNIEAMPTVKFVNAAGEVVHEFVGYGGPAQVLGEIRAARAKHRP